MASVTASACSAPLPASRRPLPGSLSPGLLQMQLVLHYDETYREVKYGNMGLPDIDSKMLIGINVTPIAALLYTPVLIRCAPLSPGLGCPRLEGLGCPAGPGRRRVGRRLAYLEG